MEQKITTSNNNSAKKQWQKPELFVLDSDSIQVGTNGKTKASFSEKTSVGGPHGASYFS